MNKKSNLKHYKSLEMEFNFLLNTLKQGQQIQLHNIENTFKKLQNGLDQIYQLSEKIDVLAKTQLQDVDQNEQILVELQNTANFLKNQASDCEEIQQFRNIQSQKNQEMHKNQLALAQKQYLKHQPDPYKFQREMQNYMPIEQRKALNQLNVQMKAYLTDKAANFQYLKQLQSDIQLRQPILNNPTVVDRMQIENLLDRNS